MEMETTYLGALYVLDPRNTVENVWVKLIEPSDHALDIIGKEKWPGLYIKNATSITYVEQGIREMFDHVCDSVSATHIIDSKTFCTQALRRIEERANIAQNANTGVLEASEEPKAQFSAIIKEITDIYTDRLNEMDVDDYTRGLLVKHFTFQMDGLRIYRDRNEKYGDSFNKNFKEFGPLYPVVRIGEKFERLKGLAKSDGHVKVYGDESFIDTLMDISNYSIMMANRIIDFEKENEVN